MVNELKRICKKLEADYSDVRKTALVVLKQIREGFSFCEFDDSPEEQSLKIWLMDTVPAVGGRVFVETDGHGRTSPVYCFIAEK